MDSKKTVIEELQKQLDCMDNVCEKGSLSGEFKVWYNNCLLTIESIFGIDSSYVRTFKEINYSSPQENTRTPEGLKRKFFLSGLDQAKAVIESCISHISEPQQKSDASVRAIQFIEDLCNRFHSVARQICTEYRGRKPIPIKDEYDVQHLLHALLLIQFDDIRPEDVNPSYAGATSRVDFLLKQEKIVVEVKKTRENLKDKEIGEQLIIDINRYKINQDCQTLICFIYDPDRLISNPKGLENDLNGKHEKLEVKVIITPKN